ncbi:Sec2p domain-containing protein [Fusarium falciforme]|uniref:Sec2p domain-containing protein n=1 Tax=Fusarium falciforme TaxID=195108 RepID=UPI0023006F78|nr:Sec2p domain-containing protein [Fusarium falciforme]WAO93863.1 Sec2p domain-containing protein [Fusarium falciforme]
MSSTMVMTMAAPPIASDDSPCCPGCGYALPLDHTQVQLLEAQARIVDLENQVRLLNEKASAAVDRWADYEDELTRLRAQLASSPTQKQLPTTPTNTRMSFLQSGTSRLSALLSPRKSHPDLGSIETNPSRPPNQRSASSGSHHQLQPPPSPSAEDLLEALSREQNLRKEAETKVAATSQEVEELSAALFEQANEMVAEERRARAKLEQRVDELERRDMEKRRRLDKLEGAMNRIERVRLLLAEAEQDVESSKQTVKEIEDLERQQEEENRRIAQRRTAGSVPESIKVPESVKENGDADSTYTHTKHNDDA